ncbi:LacI family DNA-binding transcriptional regulator [Sutcliffiella cohnii]|uniref:LacI family DNA-binding transcriptional regulator n=1 Tax=Sutcliffiella cohnii TaxID=33932 RepID=UPI002E24FC77|nr:LacI family DNA-binding transcriptional regulator [Sutcliffiella cohnii]
MKVTINDIAKIAGVAKSTVSRYLNGGQVSPETKDKIKKVIEETNYEPNSFARSLKSKRTNFIGVIAPALDSYVTSRVLMAIDEKLRENQFTSLIINTSKSIELEIESLLNLERQKVDGIILFGTEMTDEHINVIQSMNTPVLIVGQETPAVHCIVFDDYNAGYEIGKYVAGHGHEKVVYLGVYERDVAVGKVRKQGVLDGLLHEGKNVATVYETEFDIDKAARITKKIMKEQQFSALICATDNIALGAMKAIREAGKNVPEDISLTGFGGYVYSTFTEPRLTTIKFMHKETGHLAAKTMISIINGEEVPSVQKADFTLLEGNSVKKV